MKRFFTNLPLINENTYEVLIELSKKYNIIVVSIGTYRNIELKSQYIEKYLPFIKESIFLAKNGSYTSKNLVNMNGKGNVFIDDVVSNLNSVQVERKIAFGDIKSWNEKWNGERALNWTEVGNLLLG
jgi:5'(3')-deoxyribonucleotidase